MATKSFIAMRRFAAYVFTLMLFSLCLCAGAAGQQGASPLVTSSAITGLDHPAGWGTIYQTALDQQGDWLVVDYGKGALYEFPVGGGAEVTLIPAGGLGGGNNPGIAIDSNNTLYLEGNWSNCLLRFPYDSATKTWPGIATFNTNNQSGNCPAPYNFAQYSTLNGANGQAYWNWGFQPWGLAVDADNNIVAANQTSSNFMFFLNVVGTGSSASEGAYDVLLKTMAARASSVAVDPWHNVYFVEEPDQSPSNGIFVLPATVSGLPTALGITNALADEKSLTNLAPNLPATVGVATDAAGNIYASDNTLGTYLIPNVAGTPNPSAAILLTTLSGQGAVAVDSVRHIMYAPTNTVQSNGRADVAQVNFETAEFGSSPAGTPISAPVSVSYAFNGNVTPARFVIVEDGKTTPDFAVVSGGTCAVGTTYPIPATSSGSQVNSCNINVTATPQTAGNVSGQLLMQTAATINKQTVYTTVATTVLHASGMAGAVQTSPAFESAIGGSLTTPSQVATDLIGNVYVADAGHGQVLMYAAGSGASATGVSIGTGLAAPTGVAVDGAGDVFIADSGSGSVFEVPFGPGGLNTAGQLKLMSGLGANLRLAADGLGNLYVADPANGRVVRLGNLGGTAPGVLGQSETILTAGFTAPSEVAVDSKNNLFVIDGANLLELSGGLSAPTTLLNTLSNATGVAIDASGAVYVSSTGGTVRIPYVNGALIPANQNAVAISVTSPTAVAVDNLGNAYLTDGTAGSIHLVSTSGTLNLGSLATTSSTATLPVTVTNQGNAPLTITGYTSTNSVDYAATDVSCLGTALAAGGTCEFNVTFNPGPGEEGTLTGKIGIQSDAANGPIVVNATGVGASLAKTLSSLTVGTTAEVVNTQVIVTVRPQSGGAVPTGQVTVSFTTVTGATATVTGTLTNGSVTLTLSPVAAGSRNFTVSYIGDRVFGRSTATSTAIVAKSAIASLALPVNPPTFLPYVLEGFNGGGQPPYDGSSDLWQYRFTVQVNAAVGQPTGSVTFMDKWQIGSSSTLTSGVACPAHADAAVQPLDPNGKATFSTACLPMPQNVTYTPIVSTHVVTPVYSGDANYQGFTGQSTTFIAVRNPVVAIASSSPALNVSAGSSASANLTLTSMLGYGFAGKNQQLNDYNFPVSLSCSNLPPHTTCSFSYPNPDPQIPSAVDIPCSGTTAAADNCAIGLAMITINTNVPVGTTTSQIASPAPMTFAVLFGFGMIGLFFRRSLGQRGRLLLIFCLAILGGTLAVSITACSTTNLSPASVLTTPKGTYQVSVTAQQVGSQVITLPSGPITIYGSQNQVSLPFTISVTVQ